MDISLDVAEERLIDEGYTVVRDTDPFEDKVKAIESIVDDMTEKDAIDSVNKRKMLLGLIVKIEVVLISETEDMGEKECDCIENDRERVPYVYNESTDEPGTVYCLNCGGYIIG